ncbi:glycosyltransferase [Hamadaea tsunoensis]|uniref:glycosyltransferase n=1 Tax=Hamadaea tsunoensis TaxID=53368 RepID=UPI000423D0B0|nr:glycosyltransferase [Hamadaea tsunoensis]
MTQAISPPTRAEQRVQRVAHFTDTYLPRRDGVVTSLRTLCRELDADGCATVTVAPRHREQPPSTDLLTLRSVPCGVADLRLGGWPTAAALERVAHRRPDLIHVHTPGPMGLLGTIVARRLGVPLVHSYHTDLYAYAEAYRVPARALELGLQYYARHLGAPGRCGQAGEISRRHRALDGLHKLLLGRADAVIVPTPAVLERAHLPVPAERIFLVPAGVAARPVTPAEVAAFRTRWGLREDDAVALFVGRVNREKGVDLLISAFARVAARVPAARLLLIGAVYEPRWVRRLLAAAGVESRVVITGQLPPEEVAAAYACARVFAFPSLTDTQGLVLQEAALAGVPSLLCDPQLHRTGVLGETALLAPPLPDAYAEMLTALLTSPGTAKAAGARARERAMHHTPARYAATMRDVYAFAASR